MSHEIVVRPTSMLRKYQLGCAEWAYRMLNLEDNVVDDGSSLMAIDMGLGKTAIALLILRRLMDAMQVERTLVIAPLLVAETVWPDEIQSWDFSRHMTFEVLTGDVDRRSFRAESRADIHIVNRENLPWLVEYFGDRWPYEFVIVDEMQSFKNPRKRTEPTKVAIGKMEKSVLAKMPKGFDDSMFAKAMVAELKKHPRKKTRFGAFCAARPYIKAVIGLSGTPSPNGIRDLWAQFFVLNRGALLGTTIRAFDDRWMTTDRSGFKKVPRQGSFEEIMRLIKDRMISLKSEDYLELPEVVVNIVSAPMPPKAMEEYKRFKRTLVSDEYDVVADTKGILANKLLQFANGSMYVEEGVSTPIHTAKLDALERIIEEANGEPILLGYSYIFDRDAIKKKFPFAQELSDDSQMVRKWNEGKIPLLIGHPASIGHGLNLQHGGHILVWYGIPWGLMDYSQMNKRLDRSGQTKKVIIHHIVSPGTIDEHVMEVLKHKGAVQDDVLAACAGSFNDEPEDPLS